MSIKKGTRTIASSVPVTEWGSVDGTLADQVDLKSALDSKAPTYSPTFTGTPLAPTAPIDVSNNQIATTKYVQDALLNAEANLPEQTGNAGKFLTTNGQLPSWESISQVPSQVSQSGKYLTTNGTTASWSDITGFIKTSGDETITGNKTFYNRDIYIKSPSIDVTDSSSTHYLHLAFRDKNDKELSHVKTILSEGKVSTELSVCANGNTNSFKSIGVTVDNATNVATTKCVQPTDTTSTTSNQIATVGWVNSSSVGNNVVHKTGDETIGGEKSFTSWVKYNTESANTAAYNAPAFWIKDDSLDTSALPAYTKEYYVCARDNADRYMAWTSYRYNTDGSSQVSINARTRNTANTDNVSANIYLKVFKDGTVATSAPTPSSVTDNTTKIATTEWVIDVLEALYPVGSLYIGTQNSCPLSAFFGTWTLVSAGSALWTGNGQAGSGTTTNANYANAKANTTIAAGLPNITGDEASGRGSSIPGISGAFQQKQNTSGKTLMTYNDSSSSTSNYQQTFNANKSNSIYGASSTVQPPAYVVNVWRRTA